MTRGGRTASVGWLGVAIAVSLVASLTPWAGLLLYPFKLFTTWVHECSHALVTVLVGGRVQAITIQPDTSGLTEGLVPAGRLARGMVASAGYLGAAVVGCVLVAAERGAGRGTAVPLGIGACAARAPRDDGRGALPARPAGGAGRAERGLRHPRPVPRARTVRRGHDRPVVPAAGLDLGDCLDAGQPGDAGRDALGDAARLTRD